MPKNLVRAIVRVCYFVSYAAIFLLVLFVFFQDENLEILEKMLNAATIWLFLIFFLICYILAAGLSAKENFKTSIARFGGYALSFALLVSFCSAISCYFEGGGEAGMLYIFVIPFVAGATLISGIIWLINMIIIFSKTITEKKKRVIFSFLSLALVLAITCISIIVLVLGMYLASYFVGKQHNASGEVWHLIFNNQGCTVNADCIYFTHSGPFWGPINKEILGAVRQKADQYCKKYSHTCHMAYFEKKASCVNGYCRELPDASTTTDETAGWKTYRNEEYGFEVKYPQNWGLEEILSNGLRSPYSAGVDIIQPYHEERDGVYKAGSYAGIDLKLLLAPSSSVDIDNIIKDNEAHQINLGNVTAWRYEREIPGPETMVLNEEVTLIPNKEYCIEVSELKNYSPSDFNYRSRTIKTILSTFKFID